MHAGTRLKLHDQTLATSITPNRCELIDHVVVKETRTLVRQAMWRWDGKAQLRAPASMVAVCDGVQS